jgi:cytochrome o ubiquinol oxidase operon protein cyoD
MDHASHPAAVPANHGSTKSYMTGFVLSVVLTIIAFGLVIGHAVPASVAVPGVAVLALVQVVIHLIYFLHMDASEGGRWNLTSFFFAVMVAVILIGGTAWIMVNIAMNMMPN